MARNVAADAAVLCCGRELFTLRPGSEISTVGFGRNPYIAKAQAAEQKALDATDDAARTRAYRDAAHEWGRAADRECPGKQRAELERNAARNRALADGEAGDGEGDGEPDRPLN